MDFLEDDPSVGAVVQDVHKLQTSWEDVPRVGSGWEDVVDVVVDGVVARDASARQYHILQLELGQGARTLSRPYLDGDQWYCRGCGGFLGGRGGNVRRGASDIDPASSLSDLRPPLLGSLS